MTPANVVTGSFMDFFMPTAVETPHWETDFTVPSPHHPIGAKGVGESPNVGGVPAFSNAVNDAFSFLGSTHIQMPHDYWRNWKAAKELGAVAWQDRHCERSEATHPSACCAMDCFVASFLAMTKACEK